VLFDWVDVVVPAILFIICSPTVREREQERERKHSTHTHTHTVKTVCGWLHGVVMSSVEGCCISICVNKSLVEAHPSLIMNWFASLISGEKTR